MTDLPPSDEPEPDLPGAPLVLDQLRPFGDEVDDVEGQELLARLQASLFRRPAQPRVLGRWLILERKGAGAMGVVYAAYDPRLDRRVALKVLRAGRSARPEARARMLREAQALAKISDPHVVHIYDVEELEGNVCLVMELIEGPTLEAWQREPRGQREILDRYIAVAHGLAKIHEAGLVHRDVKPSNVLIDGVRVVIADFGLVLAEDEAGVERRPTGLGSTRTALELTLTEEGTLVGTLGYMAPEQLAREGATARSDQYAFFVSLYEALTGARPFRGATPRAVAEAMTVGPLPRSPIGAPIRRWLYRIMQRGLAVDPAQRFASMAEVEAVLEHGRDRGRRARTLVLVLAGAGLAALGYGLGGQDEPAEDPIARCEAMVAGLPGLWDEQHHELGQRVRARGRGLEVAAWGRLAQSFHEKDEQWRAQRRRACRPADVPASSVTELRRAGRDACVAQAERELRGYAQTLVEVGARPIEPAELDRLRARVLAVPDCAADEQPADQGEVGAAATSPELMTSLARLRAAEDLGELRNVEQRTAALAEQARVQQQVGVEGEARYLRGRALSGLGRPLEARESLAAALHAAAAADDRSLGARTAVFLAKVAANDLQDPRDGRSWLRVAEHELRASGELERRGPLHADYLEAQGLLAFAERDHERAAEHYRAALQRRLELGDAVPLLDVLESKNNLANALSRLGRKDEALARLREAVGEAEARYGAEHPLCADLWINIGKVHEAEHRLDEAADGYRRAVLIDRLRRDQGGAPALRGLLALGLVAQLEHDVTTLAEVADEIEAVHERLTAEEPNAMVHVDRAHELQRVAAARLAQDRVGESVDALRRAAAILEPLDPVEHAFSLVNLAGVLLEHQRQGEARPLLQRAVPVLDRATLDPADAEVLAEAQSWLAALGR